MSITKREGKSGARYIVRIVVEDPATGKKSQQNCGTFRTLRAAEKAEREAITQRDAGTLLKPTKMTVGEVLDEWMRVELPRSVKPENRIAYEVVINNYLKPRFGNVQVKALTVQMVESFYGDLQEQGKSTSLIKKVHMRLGSALRMAKRYGLVNSVVTEIAKAPKVSYGKKEVWTPEEVGSFLETAAEDGMSPVWRLAIESGARTSELLGLKWTDVSLEAGTVRFGRQVVRLDRGTPIIREGGKTASAERTIRVTDELVDMLREHRKSQAVKRLAAHEWIDNALVFPTRTGRPVNAAAFRRSFNRLVEDAGVRNIGPHGMRRTAITLTIAGGANVKSISARVGHRDVSTTLNIYQAITKGMDDQALDIVGTMVGAKPKEEPSIPEVLPINTSHKVG